MKPTKLDEQPTSSSTPSKLRSQSFDRLSTPFDPSHSDWIPWAIAVGLVLVIGLIGFLAQIALSNSDARSIEKKRADLLQGRVNYLADLAQKQAQASGEDQKFFDIVRQLLLAKTDADRQALIDQLRNVQFGAAPKPGTSPPSDFKSTTSTPTTSRSEPNRSPPTTPTTKPSSTTTTQPAPPPPPPPLSPPSSLPPVTICVQVAQTTICQPPTPQGVSNGINGTHRIRFE